MTAAPAGRRRYPGVRAFEEADAVLFYGRQAAADQLLLRVLSVRLLLQFAPSGVGKTSLLQAGLFPPLRGHEAFPFIARINRPEETLVQAVRRSLLEACERQDLQDPVVPEDAADLGALLAGTQLWSPDASLLTPVLVLDQFEEIFTLRDEAFRRDLARQVGALVGARPGGAGAPAVKIILSLREEFLGRLEQFSRDIPELFAERLRLPPLTGDEARSAIVEPAARDEPGWASPPFSYQPECVTELVDFIDGSSEQAPVVEPLTLQLVCAHGEDIVMKRAAAGQPQAPLTMADFGGIEGLRRLVADHYERELARLPAARRKPARAMFERGLLDPAGKRLMLEEGEIQRDHGLAREDLDLLVEGRLLRREPRNDSLFYEIGHDRLAEAIARRRGSVLPRWVKPALAAAVALVGGLAIGAYQLHGLRQEAEQQAIEAREAQAAAERAYGLLLGDDLIGRLRETGASDAMTEVLSRIGNIEGSGEVSADIKLHRLHGDLQIQRGKLALARSNYEEALKWLGVEPESRRPAVDVERARLLARQADVELRAGDMKTAHDRIAAAVVLWERALAGTVSLPDRLNASVAQGQLADLLIRQDLRAQARQPAARAVELALTAWVDAHADAAHEDTDMRYARGTAVLVLADAMLIHAQVWEDDAEAYRIVQALTTEAARLRPHSVLARQSAVAAGVYAGRAWARPLQEQPEALRSTAYEIDRLLRSDPDNLQLQRDHAAVIVQWAQQLTACSNDAACKSRIGRDRPLEVRAELFNAIGTLRRLTTLDPDRRDWIADLTWAYGVQASMSEAMASPDIALAQLDEALALLAARTDQAQDIGLLSELAIQQATRARLLLRLGRAGQADAARADALATLARLPDPDQPRWATANVLDALAALLFQTRRSAEGQAMADRAEAMRQALHTRWGEGRELATKDNDRAIELVNRAGTLTPANALPLLREAIDLQRSSVAANPFDHVLWRNLQITYEWLAGTLVDAGGDELASAEERRRALASAMATAQLVVAIEPDAKQRREDLAGLAVIQRDLVMHLRDMGRPGPATELAREAAARARDISSTGRTGSLELAILRDAYVTLAWQLADAGHDGWQEQLRVATTLGERLTRAEPSEPEHWRVLGDILADLARASPPAAQADGLRRAEQACRRSVQLEQARAGSTKAGDKIRRSIDGSRQCRFEIDPQPPR